MIRATFLARVFCLKGRFTLHVWASLMLWCCIADRINYLMEIGLTKREIAFMVRRFSPLLGYSIEEVFIPKLEFLVKTMEKPLKEIVDYPRYFSYSLEKKIKPRYWVLKGRKVECSLKDMLSKNDDEFTAEFIYVDRMLLPPAPSHH